MITLRISREDAGLVRVLPPPWFDRQLFEPGEIWVTPGVLAVLDQARLGIATTLLPLLQRHVSGDWGVIPTVDMGANLAALVSGGGPLMSAYVLHGTTLWVITESARSATTFLLPREY